MVNTFGTGQCDEKKLPQVIQQYFPIKPADIITQLDLLRPIYRSTAVGGHFGRLEPQFSREKTDRAAALKTENLGKRQ